MVVLTPEGDQFSREDPERLEKCAGVVASKRFDLLHPRVILAAPAVPSPAEFLFILEGLKLRVQVVDLIEWHPTRRRRLRWPQSMLRVMPRAAALQSLVAFIALLAWDGDGCAAQIVLPKGRSRRK